MAAPGAVGDCRACTLRIRVRAQASNVCVTGGGRVYLSDLGAAKKLQTRLSSGPCDFGSFVRLATFVGSPAAMAPVRAQRALRSASDPEVPLIHGDTKLSPIACTRAVSGCDVREPTQASATSACAPVLAAIRLWRRYRAVS